MNRKLIYALLIGALCLFIPTIIYLGSVLGGADLGVKTAFQTIQKGYYSRHKTPAYYVVQDENKWVEVWNQHDISMPKLPPPRVNFSNTTVIAVFRGEFSTGGYSIEIKEIVDKERSVVVKVEKTHPDKGSVVTMAFTQSYHIVKLDKINKNVEFETVEITRK